MGYNKKKDKKIENILENVRKRIVPGVQAQSSMKKMVSVVLNKIKSCITELGLPVEAQLMGSVAKDTWLAEKKEIDIFLLFEPDVAAVELKESGLYIGRTVIEELGGKYLIEYAEHPYINGVVGEFNIDIVPCYAVDSPGDLISSVDRTPFHTRYVKNVLREKKGLNNEIRLLKQFAKGCGIYGSDAKKMGFSGYLCELLVIYYNGFIPLLEAAADWDIKEFIDIEEHAVKRDFSDPLVVIDPVDPKRNVAAALSRENYDIFREASRIFLDNPSEYFFFPETINILRWDQFLKKYSEFFGENKVCFICFQPPQIISDILWPQMRKFVKKIIKQATARDFRISMADVWTDDENLAVIVLRPERWQLPFKKKHIGPPITSDIYHQQRFRKKYRDASPRIENGRWIVEIERKYKSFDMFLIDTIKKDVKTLTAYGCPKNIAAAISDSDLLCGEKIRKYYLTNEEFARYLIKKFSGKRPWEYHELNIETRASDGSA